MSGNGQNGNGNGNGHRKKKGGKTVASKEAEAQGGQGDDRAGTILDPHHRRESFKIIHRAATQGWKIPQEWMDTLPQVAAQIAADQGAPRRDRIRAMQLLRTMDKDKTEAAQALEHIERLDRGDPTEIVVNREQLTFD